MYAKNAIILHNLLLINYIKYKMAILIEIELMHLSNFQYYIAYYITYKVIRLH